MSDDERTAVVGDGLRISRIVHGLWQVADQERLAKSNLDLATSAKALDTCAVAGFSTFDMADHYGSAEEIVGTHRKMDDGRAAGDKLQKITVFTKWCPKPAEMTVEAVEEGINRSLARMQCASAAGDGAGCEGAELHLMQFHWWDYLDPRYLDALKHMDAMRRAGRFRNLGLTNFDTSHLRVALAQGVRIATNQVCFSLLDMRPAGQMTELCLAHGVRLLAFGTVAGGFLTDKWLGKEDPGDPDVPGNLRTWSEMKYKRFIDIWSKGDWQLFQRLLKALRAVADKHTAADNNNGGEGGGFTIANVAVRYILDQPAVASVIVGLRLGESEHFKDNEQVYRLALDDADRSSIQEVLKEAGTVPGDCGDEYRKEPFLTASGDLSDHLEMLKSGAKRPQGMYGLTRAEPAAAIAADPGSYEGARVMSGSTWESLAGFCRALRRKDRIMVSGTTATAGRAAVADKCALVASLLAPGNENGGGGCWLREWAGNAGADRTLRALQRALSGAGGGSSGGGSSSSSSSISSEQTEAEAEAEGEQQVGVLVERVAQLCARAQTTFVLDKIEASIRMLGGAGLEDVSRTRIFVPHTQRDWLPIALEHGYRLGATPPANTLVGAALVGEGDEYQVEIEAEAEL